jgi:hypothetical protein
VLIDIVRVLEFEFDDGPGTTRHVSERFIVPPFDEVDQHVQEQVPREDQIYHDY